MAPDLKAFAQRFGLEAGVQLDGDGRPVLDVGDEEQLSISYTGIDLALGDAGARLGSGTLHLTTRRVIWVATSSGGDAGSQAAGAPSSSSSSSSLACSYRQISMHAVSRDGEAYGAACVYVQLDEGSEAMADDDDDDDEGEGAGEELTAELRLVPADESQVEPIFAALCECSALNPDSDMQEEAGAQLFFDEDEVMAGLPDAQRAALLAAQAEGALGLADEQAELEELMADDPGRFEDEEEEEEDEEGGADAGKPGAAPNGHAAGC